MVKWTKKVLRYTKTIFFLVKGLKVVGKRCLNLISFHDDLCCCVEYSNVGNQVEILNTVLIIKTSAQKQMVEFGFGHRFHDHNYFELEMFFYIPWIYYLLEGIIWNFAENHQLNVILSHLKQIPDNHLLIQHHLLAQHLHRRLQHVDFPWAFFLCHHTLLGFADQYVSKMSMVSLFTIFKVSV